MVSMTFPRRAYGQVRGELFWGLFWNTLQLNTKDMCLHKKPHILETEHSWRRRLKTSTSERASSWARRPKERTFRVFQTGRIPCAHSVLSTVKC